MSEKNPQIPSLDSLKAVLIQLAKTIKRIKGSLNWLALPKDLRMIIAGAFDKIPASEIASLLGKDEAMIIRWKEEARHVEMVLCKILEHQADPSASHLMENDEVVNAVIDLVKVASIRRVSEAFENRISPSTIGRWIRKQAGIIDKRIMVKISEDTSASALTSDGVAEEMEKIKTNVENVVTPDISESTDGCKLSAMILRHRGKKRWKYSSAEKRLILSLAVTYGSKALHDSYGIAYDTISRIRRHADEGFEPKPHVPLKYAPVVELMDKYPGMGPMQVKDYIRRHLGLTMGVNSVRNVMEQNGWVPPYARTSRVKDAMRHYQAVRKNYMWHIDFKHHYINQTKVAILLIQDDYSRFIVGHSYSDSENMDIVITTVEEAIAIHGKPEVIMSDGGSAFYSWRGVSSFTRLLEDHGIDHYIAKSANVNGKIESVCFQVEKELLNVITFSSLRHFETEFAAWIGFYNFKRPHSGLGDCHVPADRYYPGASLWFSGENELIRQKGLIAETMATLLNELKKPKSA